MQLGLKLLAVPSVMKDAEHLLRVAVVFVIGVIAFLALRALMMPHSFGQYGHYRGHAIAEVAALPIVHAGHETCEGCHSEIADGKVKGKHAHVNCEACHGPQAKHASADDPSSMKPPKPDSAVLCAQCHEASGAKPKWFPQVATAEHSGGAACATCHNPHNPLESPDDKSTDKPNEKSGDPK